MIDKTKLRGTDIVTGIIFLILGIVILVMAFQMPLTDSYGGVNSVWYVSPALFPIIIGIGMILLAISIIVYGVKNDCINQLKISLSQKKGQPILTDSTVNLIAVIVPLCSIVYINLKAIDFYFSICIYLLVTTSMFYFDSKTYLRKTLLIHIIEEVVILVLVATKANKLLEKLFFASMDIIALVSIIILIVNMTRFVRKNTELKLEKKMKSVLLVSFITPLIIIPVFRFALRVPMPKEGIVVNLMSMLYYALFR